MSEHMSMEIEPAELNRRIDSGESIVIIDCRTTAERALACLENTIHVPMTELGARLEELREHDESHVVVHCHHGVRSLQVTHALRNEGFELTQSLAGGIDRWSLEINPSIPRY